MVENALPCMETRPWAAYRYISWSCL